MLRRLGIAIPNDTQIKLRVFTFFEILVSKIGYHAINMSMNMYVKFIEHYSQVEHIVKHCLKTID